MYIVKEGLDFQEIYNLLNQGHKEVGVRENNALFAYDGNTVSCEWNGGIVSSNIPLSPESLSHLLSEASNASWSIVQKARG